MRKSNISSLQEVLLFSYLSFARKDFSSFIYGISPNVCKRGCREKFIQILEFYPVWLQEVIFWFHNLSQRFFSRNSSFSKVLVEDLFGEVAKEREVEKIANKLPEAKTCKSFDTFEILAKFAGTRSLTGLVSPLKEVGLDYNTSRRETSLFWYVSLPRMAWPTVFVSM